MKTLTLERFGQLLETGILGFGALWAAWAVLLAI